MLLHLLRVKRYSSQFCGDNEGVYPYVAHKGGLYVFKTKHYKLYGHSEMTVSLGKLYVNSNVHMVYRRKAEKEKVIRRT